MKKLILSLSLSLLWIQGVSQITFEKGYYISNSDERVECLIKNIDWNNNPNKFEYKLSDTASETTATMESVKEFGIYNASKYIKAKVNIDRSSKNVADLSKIKNPIFNEEVLFLKVLIEGTSTLYKYADGSLIRFFYLNANSTIDQLVFKSYKTQDGKVGVNNGYKQQLWRDLKCSTITLSKVENVSYKTGSLVSFFIEHNQCNNQEFINFEQTSKKNLFKCTFRAGLNSSSLGILYSLNQNSLIDFGNKSTFRIGVEAEFIMPFNKNKWSVVIEPTFQNFKSEVDSDIGTTKVDYNSIEVPVSIRHYFYLNENSTIFLNGSIIFDMNSNSNIDINGGLKLEIGSANNLAIGLGYKHNDKYSLELRYHTRRELLNFLPFWISDYKTVSVIFGYSILQ